ncbi:MAG: nickel pincer cofactor biosynthesis protein LarC [Acidimicrobiales bacterium]|nr:nickel pincer cofactor biosynthesis protein LarC [Acidimicrobiales bacterium]
MADVEAAGTAPATVAWFHCFSGVAGDMTLGALVDAGADLAEVRALCERLPVGGWALTAEPVLRGGIAGTHVRVVTDEQKVVRTFSHIVGLVEAARLPARVEARALGAFTALADVEGHLHRRPASQVHFHEVGALDALIDVVGSCAAMEVLGVDRVEASAVATGTGMVRTEHGLLPNPAPAVVSLLRGAPTYGIEVPVELTTPTGAALLAATVSRWGPLPPLTIAATGFGAGTRELDDRPNLLQVVVGTAADRPVPGQPVVVVEVTVDDVTGETLAHAVATVLEAGAHDAWVTPVVMKKGRPGHVVTALADPALAGQVALALRRETGSLGVRATTSERWPAARAVHQVEVGGEPVRVKVSPGRVKVEHDDAARAADRTGLPLREVVSLAEEAWRRRPPDDEAG